MILRPTLSHSRERHISVVGQREERRKTVSLSPTSSIADNTCHTSVLPYLNDCLSPRKVLPFLRKGGIPGALTR